MTNPTLPDHGVMLDPELLALVPVGGKRRPVKVVEHPAFRASRARAALNSPFTVVLMPEYDGNPAHAFLRMLDRANGLAPGDPARMAARIIESVEVEQAPLRLVLGSLALQSTIDTLAKRIEGFEAQRDLAATTDFPIGE